MDDVGRDFARTTWVNCGKAHGYYRHASGKVILAISRHNSRIWRDLRESRAADFVVTKASNVDAAPKREMEMLSI